MSPTTSPANGTERVAVGGPTARSGTVRRLTHLVREYGTIIGMVLVIAVFGILKPQILAPSNLASVVDQTAYLVILATGLAVVMMMRGVDLSVAQVSDSAGILAAVLLVQDQPIWIVFLAPILFGLAIGAANGTLMAYLGVPAIIGTLGMMFVVRAAGLVMSNGRVPQVLFSLPADQTASFLYIGQGAIGPLSVAILIAAVVTVLGYLLTRMTTYGRYLDAIGGNVRAAYLAGVQHRLVFAAGFVISAVAAAIAGMVLTARTAIAVPGAFEPSLLDAFVAIYLGGALAPSGRINVIGTAVGALFVGLIGNALTLMGLGIAIRYVVYGSVILAAMAIGVLRRREAG